MQETDEHQDVGSGELRSSYVLESPRAWMICCFGIAFSESPRVRAVCIGRTDGTVRPPGHAQSETCSPAYIASTENGSSIEKKRPHWPHGWYRKTSRTCAQRDLLAGLHGRSALLTFGTFRFSMYWSS